MKSAPYTKEYDGTFIDGAGRQVFISAERFISHIAQGDSCFICGRLPSSVPFNKEHVLPNWILRGYGIREASITVPGGLENKYSEYLIPCCTACNSALGDEFEAPISRAIKGGWNVFTQFLQRSENIALLYRWLALIFLKTHLKDKTNPMPSELGQGSLAQFVDWTAMHHLHCLVRTQFSGSVVGPGVQGTFMVFQMRLDEEVEPFDYADWELSKTIMLRVGEVGMIAVMNDSEAAGNKIRPFLTHLSSVTKLQLREIFARVADLNSRIEARPQYFTAIDRIRSRLEIGVRIPTAQPMFSEITSDSLGPILKFACGEFVNDGARKQLGAGAYTFFRIDSKGYFHRLDSEG